MVKKRPRIAYTDVFVPGGLPTYTYNPRESRSLEDAIREATSNYKLLVITGSTKSGKTVLVNKVFPRAENLWIDGGAINTENSFWELIVTELGGYTEEQLSLEDDQQHTISAGIELEGSALIAKANAASNGTIGHTENGTFATQRNVQ